MHRHPVVYQIISHDIQMVELTLDPGGLLFGSEGLFLATLNGSGIV